MSPLPPASQKQTGLPLYWIRKRINPLPRPARWVGRWVGSRLSRLQWRRRGRATRRVRRESWEKWGGRDHAQFYLDHKRLRTEPAARVGKENCCERRAEGRGTSTAERRGRGGGDEASFHLQDGGCEGDGAILSPFAPFLPWRLHCITG